MAFESIKKIQFILLFSIMIGSCSNAGEASKTEKPNDSIIEKEEDPSKIGEIGENGEQLNLNHAIRLESHPRRKVSCNLYKEIKPGISEEIFKIDGDFKEWVSVESSFSSTLDLKMSVSKENLFISANLLDHGIIKSISVELGRLGFSSENEVKVESIQTLSFDQKSKYFIQKGKKFELQIEKDDFSRVGHSAIWYASLNIQLVDETIKVLPIFKPSIDFNRNSDFEIHKCHLENSKSSQDFDIINESNLDLEAFNPILQNAIALTYFDHLSEFKASKMDVYGAFPILITSDKEILNTNDLNMLRVDLKKFEDLYYSSDITDIISNKLFEKFVHSIFSVAYDFESSLLLDFVTNSVVYSNLLNNYNKTLLIKKYISDKLYNFQNVAENSPKRLSLLLADKISVKQYLDVLKKGKSHSITDVFDGLREVLGSSIVLENGYFQSGSFLATYHPAQTLDDDLDGLFNYYEVTLGTKPSLRDTDGDGWSDGSEFLQGSLPNMSLEYPKNVIIDGNFGDWVTLNPSLVKYDERNDEKGCSSKIDIDVFGAALLDSALLFGLSTKHLEDIGELIWEVQIETGDIGKTAVLRAKTNEYNWELYSSEGQLVLRQPLLQGINKKDFEAWVPTRLLSSIDEDAVSYLNLRIVLYSLINGKYEMCDDTQWIRIAKAANDN